MQAIDIHQINASLEGIGLPQINSEQQRVLLRHEPSDRILRACHEAKHNPEAKSYLSRWVQYAIQQTSPRGDRQQRREPANANVASAHPRASGPRLASHGGQTQPKENSYDTVHVYGGKAALCFEADMTRGEVPTVALDGTRAVGERQYDWNSKTRVQMTRMELPIVASVFLGFLPSCEFKNHGPENNKGFSIENQGGKLYTKVFAPETVIGVPISPGDAFFVSQLIITQLCKQRPELDGGTCMSLLRHVAARLASGH